MWKNVEETLSGAARRVLAGLAEFLPSLMALLLALLLSMLLAWMIRVILRRALRSIKFDTRLEQWGFAGLAEFSPGKSPTQLVCRVFSWIVILLGLLVGLAAVQAKVTSRILLRLVEYFPTLLVALAVLFFGTLLARFLARGVLVTAVNLQIQSARLLSQAVKWLLLIVTYAMALEHLGIGGDIVKIAFALLFGGVILALALASGLGSQDVVRRAWEKRNREQPPKKDDTLRHL
jgi:hypothetical protein